MSDVEAGIIANCLGRFLEKTVFSDAILGSFNLNIRWHKTQLLPWDYAYAYVTPGLHTYFSDITISISMSIRKWKGFLFVMLMLMLMSLLVYTAYVYAWFTLRHKHKHSQV